MKHKIIKELIDKYYSGETTLKEEYELRSYFSRQEVAEELKPYTDQFRYQNRAKEVRPEAEFDAFEKINSEQHTAAAASMQSIRSRVMFDPDSQSSTHPFMQWPLRIAAGFALLIIGYAAGQFIEYESNLEYASTRQVAHLQQEIEQMKNALMSASAYQPASAGERLSAVHISTRIPADDNRLDKQIIDILVYTMNNDKNVNVRIAAAQALYRFRDDPSIQASLIHGLSEQDDPLMQITLIDMLVEVKAKKAINEMEKLLVDSDTQDIVRERLQAGIAQLKV